uniref:SGNH hydrolase-type esterase domain-containing protein n=1 Tax=Oryzias latipes TaxID=8090 RepID=A0A3P9LXI4_ORYLA
AWRGLPGPGSQHPGQRPPLSPPNWARGQMAVCWPPGPATIGSARKCPPSPRSKSKGPGGSDCSGLGSSLSPQPLFPPTTLIVGDCITRNIRYTNAILRCFPGAKAKDLLEKLPEVLLSLPTSVIRIVVHTGTNDTALQQSEIIKKEFRELFTLLSNTGKMVFISGPIPTLTRGSIRFSRMLLSLSIWLHSASSLNRFVFIDNFNLFWNRTSFYKTDGIHPSPLGSNVLAANIRHSVQTSPAPIMPTPVQTSSSSVQTSVCGSD